MIVAGGFKLSSTCMLYTEGKTSISWQVSPNKERLGTIFDVAVDGGSIVLREKACGGMESEKALQV